MNSRIFLAPFQPLLSDPFYQILKRVFNEFRYGCPEAILQLLPVFRTRRAGCQNTV